MAGGRWQMLKLWGICIFLCAGNGLPFFCTLYIPNTAQKSMQEFLNSSVLSPNRYNPGDHASSDGGGIQLSMLWSVFIAEMAMGQFVGYIVSSPIIDKLGRRSSLLLTAFMQIPSQLCHILAEPLNFWPLLYIGRLLSMMTFAISSVIVPVFLSEVSPKAIRGSLGTVFPLSLAIGALLGGVLGTRSVLGSPEKWPFAFIVPLSFSLIVVPMIPFLPETPVFLAARNKKEKAKEALLFYQGNNDELEQVFMDSGKRQDPMSTDPNDQKKSGSTTGFYPMIRMFKKKSLRRPLFLTLSIAVSFCCAGITIVSAYSTAILTLSGLHWSDAEICTIGLKVLSVVNYVACLFLVDRIGRRPLLLGSLGGCAVAWTLLTGCVWLSNKRIRSIATAVIIFLVQFFMNIGIRPLFYVLVPELFPFEFRTAGKSLSAMVGTFITIPMLFGFWPLLKIIGNYVYAFLAIPLWLCLAYVYKTCPETKGRSAAVIFKELKLKVDSHHNHNSENSSENVYTFDPDTDSGIQIQINPIGENDGDETELDFVGEMKDHPTSLNRAVSTRSRARSNSFIPESSITRENSSATIAQQFFME